VHHSLGAHSYNYTDFPLWDILSGTFRNPPEYRGRCGFEDGADRRMLAMLAFVDVNAAAYGKGNRGQRPRAAPVLPVRGATVSVGGAADSTGT